MSPREPEPVHVDVVLPDAVWRRLRAAADLRGSTIAGEIAEALIHHLAHRDPDTAPLLQLQDEIRRARRAGYRTPSHASRRATA